MRYRENWCFCGCADVDPGIFARLVNDHAANWAVNGHPDRVGLIVALLQRYAVAELQASFFCQMPLDTVLAEPTWPTRRATLADIGALTKLYAKAGIKRREANDIRRHLSEGCRYVVTQDGSHIVSAVCTTVATSNAAMVGGVFTPSQWRNRGYATAAITHLCSELVNESKQPCLFYANPAAGSIYHRLGFQDIGPWHLILLNPVITE